MAQLNQTFQISRNVRHFAECIQFKLQNVDDSSFSNIQKPSADHVRYADDKVRFVPPGMQTLKRSVGCLQLCNSQPLF